MNMLGSRMKFEKGGLYSLESSLHRMICTPSSCFSPEYNVTFAIDAAFSPSLAFQLPDVKKEER